jgi:hypothetical protein
MQRRTLVPVSLTAEFTGNVVRQEFSGIEESDAAFDSSRDWSVGYFATGIRHLGTSAVMPVGFEGAELAWLAL